MEILRRLKKKILCLIERIRLSESDYLNMKSRSQMYDNMLSTIECNSTVEYEEVRDKEHHIVARFSKSKTMTVHIDIEKMLAAGGIVFDKNAVILNVTGF